MKRYVVILILIVLTVLIPRFFFGPGLHDRWMIKSSWLSKANLEGKYDLLALGDSRVLYGINPDELLALHQKGLNFAFPSMSMTKTYLDKAESLIGERGKVIIGLTPEGLTTFESDKSLTNHIVHGPVLMYQAFHWFRTYWPQVGLYNLLQNRSLRTSSLFPPPLQEVHHQNGWVESHLPFQGNGSVLYHYKELAKKYKIDLFMIDSLVKKTGDWTSRGIEVNFLWVCFDKEICQEEKRLLPDHLRKEISARLAGAGAYEILTEGNFGTYDGDHLTGKEAIRFSQEIAQKLNRKTPLLGKKKEI